MSKNRFIGVLLVVIFFLFFASVVEAATLRVPQDYSTVMAAYDAANHGDEILVAPGNYNVCLSNNRSKRIRLRAQNLATSSQASQQSVLNSACSHAIQFRTPIDNDGVFNQGEVVEFIGFVFKGSDDAFSYESASGIVRNNIISGQSDDPVDIDGGSEARVFSNILKDGTGGGDGIENRLHSFSSSRTLLMVFMNNIIYKSKRDGIQLIDQTGSHTKRKYLIVNNLIIDNGQAGLGTTKGGDSNQLNWPGGYALPEKIYVLHNTFIRNGMGGILGGANMVVHNNIFYNNTTVDLKNVSGNSVASHNLFYGPAADNQGSNVQSPNVTTDPKFTNTSAPPGFSSFQLSPDSPAIDAGKNVDSFYREFNINPPGFSGSAPDLGWQEQGSAPPVTIPPTVTTYPPGDANGDN
ncbi:MAG: right-handed parallel beta-helix repeat-containing protein, partial [Candidatus Hodarchaeales archaeon]